MIEEARMRGDDARRQQIALFDDALTEPLDQEVCGWLMHSGDIQDRASAPWLLRLLQSTLPRPTYLSGRRRLDGRALVHLLPHTRWVAMASWASKRCRSTLKKRPCPR